LSIIRYTGGADLTPAHAFREHDPMVRLSKIYTKFGDGGHCMLGDGSTVPKTSPRVEAYGEVDEANSTIGVAVVEAHRLGERFTPMTQALTSIQNDMFDVGADLCAPIASGEKPGERLRVEHAQVERIEAVIDEYNASLRPLNSFVLPGGTALGAALHVARATVRRAERAATHLRELEPDRTNEQACVYLNRVSDLLFVFARWANHEAGAGDVLWTPGASRSDGGKE
jgi:cob(I)alamin adenosyltransferase